MQEVIKRIKNRWKRYMFDRKVVNIFMKIKEEYIVLNRFRTFNSICKIICDELGVVENEVS